MENILEMSFKIPSDVVAHEIGDGVFIYHNKLGTCFGLEGIGLEIWQMICEGKIVADIIYSIQKEYDADEVTVNEDVHSFIKHLIKSQLLDTGREVN
ncbi:MAG TPA: PqqD family protein [Bacillus sp. (in: firmicutes)]|jgi:hypothetical protein|nr:hypothetical protein ADL26_04435 [Thermoactinomyces vulgaris]HWO76383.1 PqqD family protein [Bacillus sp. (in: firmicutes)]